MNFQPIVDFSVCFTFKFLTRFVYTSMNINWDVMLNDRARCRQHLIIMIRINAVSLVTIKNFSLQIYLVWHLNSFIILTQIKCRALNHFVEGSRKLLFFPIYFILAGSHRYVFLYFLGSFMFRLSIYKCCDY